MGVLEVPNCIWEEFENGKKILSNMFSYDISDVAMKPATQLRDEYVPVVKQSLLSTIADVEKTIKDQSALEQAIIVHTRKHIELLEHMERTLEPGYANAAYVGALRSVYIYDPQLDERELAHSIIHELAHAVEKHYRLEFSKQHVIPVDPEVDKTVAEGFAEWVSTVEYRPFYQTHNMKDTLNGHISAYYNTVELLDTVEKQQEVERVYASLDASQTEELASFERLLARKPYTVGFMFFQKAQIYGADLQDIVRSPPVLYEDVLDPKRYVETLK